MGKLQKGAENIEEDGSLDGCFEMLDSFLCKQDAETRKNSLSKPFNLKFAFRSSPKKPKTKSTDAVTGPSGIVCILAIPLFFFIFRIN